MKERFCSVGAVLGLLLTIGAVTYVTWFQKATIPLPPLALVFEAKVPSLCTGQLLVGGRPLQYTLAPSTDYKVYTLQLPELGEPLVWVRLDPMLSMGELWLRNMVIMEGSNVIRRLDTTTLESLNPQAKINWTGNELRIMRSSEQDYPAFYVTRIYPIRTATDGYPRMSGIGVAGIWFVVICVTIALLMKVGRELRLSDWPARMVWVGAFLAILGGRFLTIHLLGVSFHQADAWDHEPWYLYFPFQDGNLSWRHLFAPCNEHRIFFTRILSLGVFLVNGQWDNLVLASCNNIVYACAFTGMGLLLWHQAGRCFLSIFALAITLLGTLPFAWENTVWSFQSQFYFCVAFSVLILWLLLSRTPRDTGWYLGIAAAVWCLFTVGAGRLPAIVICCIMVLRLWVEPRQWKTHMATLLACAGVLGFERLLPSTPEIWSMKTRTIDQFIATFGKTFSWPFVGSEWMWILVWLPMFCLVVNRFRKRQEISSFEWLVFAIGGWGFISALGVGLKRGAFSQGPVSRYMDMTSLALLANVAAILALYMRLRPVAARRCALAGCAWALVMGCGLAQVSFDQLNYNAGARLAYNRLVVRPNIITFLREDKLSQLLSLREAQLPHPDQMAVATYLRCPRIRAILPSSIRPPVSVMPDAVSGFSVGGIGTGHRYDIVDTIWGSFGPQGNMGWGDFRSQPLRRLALPWLEFEVMGDMYTGLRRDNFYLRLQDPASLRESTASDIDWNNGRYGSVTMKAPCSNPLITAMDHDSAFWMSFTEPREKSTLSVWVAFILRFSSYLLSGGIGLMAIAFYLMSRGDESVASWGGTGGRTRGVRT
jgi:hypothetical protein